jgi:steroid 5-alpha reductase family enzyme
MSGLFSSLAFNLGLLMIGMLLLWTIAVKIRDVSFIDAVWAYGMGVLALVSFFVALDHLAALGRPASALSNHAIALAVLTTLWAVRLGTHLLLRWRRLGPDPRYVRILGGAMAARGWSYATASLIIVFMLQGPLLWFVSLPAQVGILTGVSGSHLGSIAIAGCALALIGIGFETIGDAQLEAFRKDPSNAGTVMDRGLWRYTRHPNYFGDACTWWGLWLISAETGAGLWTIASPMLLTWMLMRWSGAPILEKGLTKSRPGYADYVARTSGFIPLPPKG